MRREAIAIALTGLCLVGASACQRPGSDQEPRGESSPASAGKPVHPSVPGRNIPCPQREAWTRRAIHANRPHLGPTQKASPGDAPAIRSCSSECRVERLSFVKKRSRFGGSFRTPTGSARKGHKACSTTMKSWIVSCDSCPYRERFLTRLEAERGATQHVFYRIRHRTNVSEEER